MTVTARAAERLRRLLQDHPEEEIVRIRVTDLDEQRLTFLISLEGEAQPDDVVQQIDGLTVALDPRSAPRLDGVTVDFHETDGFRFLHPDSPGGLTFLPFSLN